jgi:hypothetical protein
MLKKQFGSFRSIRVIRVEPSVLDAGLARRPEPDRLAATWRQHEP